MPPARRRDPQTGRYISSRENTEDLAGPSQSVPGVLDELIETIDRTETAPGASEMVKIEPTETTEATVYETAEMDETVERTEPDERIQGASSIKIDNPSRQLQAELAVEMATTPIPKPKEAKPIKLVQFKIPNLIKQNIRTWKSDVREFCKIQGVWEVVEQTLQRQNKPEEL
jgi:hypothetical protein